MQKTAYPYCPHGKYVGGCGADYMCMACEMGEETLSPRELEDAANRLGFRVLAEVDDFVIFAEAHGIALDRALDLCFNTRGIGVYDLIRRYNSATNELAFAREWAENDDDANWLWKHHEHQVKEWNEATGEEQFWSLPEHVLDGP